MPKTMSELTREETLGRLQDLIDSLRVNAREGHMPYIIDALQLIVNAFDYDTGTR